MVDQQSEDHGCETDNRNASEKAVSRGIEAAQESQRSECQCYKPHRQIVSSSERFAKPSAKE